MRGGRELWGRGPARRVTGTVQRVSPVFVPQSVKKRWTFLDLPAATRAVTEQLPDSMPHVGDTLALVLTNAGLVERDSAHGYGAILLVGHYRHDMYLLEASDGLAIEMSDQLVWPEPCLPGWAILIDTLDGRNGGK